MCRYCNDEKVKEVLSERELRVVHFRETGKSFKQIAEIFGVSRTMIYQLSFKGYRKLKDLDFHFTKKKSLEERNRDKDKRRQERKAKGVCKNRLRLRIMEELIAEGIFTDYKGEYAKMKGAMNLSGNPAQGKVIGRKWKVLCPKCEATGEVEFNEYIPLCGRSDLHIKCHKCGHLISDVYFKEESNG